MSSRAVCSLNVKGCEVWGFAGEIQPFKGVFCPQVKGAIKVFNIDQF